MLSSKSFHKVLKLSLKKFVGSKTYDNNLSGLNQVKVESLFTKIFNLVKFFPIFSIAVYINDLLTSSFSVISEKVSPNPKP